MTKSEQKYFLPYQAAWIRDESPLKIVEKSRQIGFSYADSYQKVTRVSRRGARLNEWVGSRDLMQAKEYLKYCKKWTELLQIAAEDLGEQLIDRSRDLTAFVLRFANGLGIYSLSSNPDAFAGKPGNVTLDEFALHREQRELYRIAKPCTTWGGQLGAISTHRGTGTVFNEICTSIKEKGNPMGWSHHRVTILDAVAQGLVEKIDEKTGRSRGDAETRRREFIEKLRAECLDEEQWQQEYMCVPADESTAFITYDMITGCESPGCLKGFEYLLDAKNPLYVGMDVARKKDLCVIDVGEKIGDVIWDRLRLELKGRTFSEIEFELYRVLALPQVRRCAIDATGLGMQLAERASEKFGDYKVEGVTFTGPVKEELAFPLRSAFEDKTLRIDGDPALRADLRGIKKETTLSGNIRFVGESEDSHCDRFWAKALRQYAACQKKVEMSAVLI